MCFNIKVEKASIVPTDCETVMTQHPEWFTVIKVDLKMDGHTVLLTSVDNAGAAMMQRIFEGGPETFNWKTGGTKYTDSGKSGVLGFYINCGGTPYQHTERTPQGGSYTTSEYQNAIKVFFDVSEVSDEYAVWKIRGFNYFTDITLDNSSTAEEFRLTPTALCKVCKGSLVKFIELEWRVCDECSAKCEHDYVEGPGRSKGQLVYLRFCDKCGRGDPAWKCSDSPLANAIEVVEKGGLDMVILEHEDGSQTIIT